MSDLMKNAIRKINAEMQKNPDDRYTEIIGQYIIDRCGDDITAAKVMADNKSLKGAMDAVVEKARKAKNGNVAVLMPEVVFGEVDQYFDLSTDCAAQERAMMAACSGMAAAPTSAASAGINISLSDFL